ncbi:MAG: type IV pilus modification PilV family protein [Candidatus Saccharimonadales bacterium]
MFVIEQHRQRGDTLIEVIMAFAVFSLVAVGALMLMNRGTAAAQAALEITQTQKVIASQEEVLKYLRDAYTTNKDASGPSAAMRDILANRLVTIPSQFSREQCPALGAFPNRAFALNPSSDFATPTSGIITTLNSMDDVGAPAFPQINTAGMGSSSGVWIEAVRGDTETNAPAFIDFHVRACWLSPSSGIITTGTTSRLYMPYLGTVADEDE